MSTGSGSPSVPGTWDQGKGTCRPWRPVSLDDTTSPDPGKCSLSRDPLIKEHWVGARRDLEATFGNSQARRFKDQAQWSHPGGPSPELPPAPSVGSFSSRCQLPVAHGEERKGRGREKGEQRGQELRGAGRWCGERLLGLSFAKAGTALGLGGLRCPTGTWRLGWVPGVTGYGSSSGHLHQPTGASGVREGLKLRFPSLLAPLCLTEQSPSLGWLPGKPNAAGDPPAPHAVVILFCGTAALLPPCLRGHLQLHQSCTPSQSRDPFSPARAVSCQYA